jgi:hypothetical protein
MRRHRVQRALSIVEVRFEVSDAPAIVLRYLLGLLGCAAQTISAG